MIRVRSGSGAATKPLRWIPGHEVRIRLNHHLTIRDAFDEGGTVNEALSPPRRKRLTGCLGDFTKRTLERHRDYRLSPTQLCRLGSLQK